MSVRRVPRTSCGGTLPGTLGLTSLRAIVLLQDAAESARAIYRRYFDCFISFVLSGLEGKVQIEAEIPRGWCLEAREAAVRIRAAGHDILGILVDIEVLVPAGKEIEQVPSYHGHRCGLDKGFAQQPLRQRIGERDLAQLDIGLADHVQIRNGSRVIDKRLYQALCRIHLFGELLHIRDASVHGIECDRRPDEVDARAHIGGDIRFVTGPRDTHGAGCSFYMPPALQGFDTYIILDHPSDDAVELEAEGESLIAELVDEAPLPVGIGMAIDRLRGRPEV